MKTEMVEFKIWGTEKYVLVTDRIDDEAAYRFKNVRTQKVSSKNVSGFDDNGRHYTLKQCIWKYVPYFKQMAKSIEECGVKVPGFGNYLFLKESRQLWNVEKFNFLDFDKNGCTSIRRNGKSHTLTYNQTVYMTEKNVDYEMGYNYIDASLGQDHFIEDVDKIVRMSRSDYQRITGFKENFDAQISNKDHKLSIDYFFDKMELLELDEVEIEKIQLGIIDKYL